MLVALATVLLSGCFRYESTTVVEADGSGTAQEILAVDRTTVAAELGTDTNVEAHVPRAADFPLPGWVTVRDYADGTFEGVVMDIAFDAPEQFNERMNDVHRRLATLTGSNATSAVELSRLNDGWAFSMTTGNLAELPTPPAAKPPAPAAASARLSELYHDAELVITVQLPGRLVEHNADQRRDNRLTWRLSAQSVQTQIYARSTTNGTVASVRTSGTLQIATAVATLGGLGVFVAVARSRRSSSDAAPGSEPTLHLGDPIPSDVGPPAAWPAQPPAQPPVEGRTPGHGPRQTP